MQENKTCHLFIYYRTFKVKNTFLKGRALKVMLRRLSQQDKTLRDGGVTGVKSKLFSGLEPEKVGRMVLQLVMGQRTFGRHWKSE